MESLVSMAKCLGIRSNPKMNESEKEKVLNSLYREIQKHFPLSRKPKDSLHTDFRTILSTYYDLHKKIDRPLQNPKQFEVNYEAYEHPLKGVDLVSQDNAFRWHDARQKGIFGCERFVADIQLDSAHFPEMIKKLDAFILKYKAGYKIPVRDKRANRSDTLNLYFPKNITPGVAKEFVEIIRPCLSKTYNDYLNGRPLTEKGQMIKGVKVGPEYKHLSTEEGLSKIHDMKARCKKDLDSLDTGFDISGLIKPLVWVSSLGEKESAIATLDLAYYLAGKEGQNPYQLLDYQGSLYPKQLATDASSFSIRAKLFQSSLKQQVSGGIGSLFHSLKLKSKGTQSLRQKMMDIYTAFKR